jgi:hypothetical protein
MNMGELDGFNRNSIKDFLVEISGINARVIFNVDVKNSFSFFETENKHVDEFLALNKKGIEFNARVISFEVSKAKPSGGYGEKRSYGGGSREDGRRSYGGGGGGERRSYGGNREGGERKSYGGNREGGERKTYGGGESRSYSGGGERRSSFGGNKEGGERSSFGGGERKPFNREGGSGGGGERRSFDKPTGDRSFSGNREGAERRKRFTK